MLKAVAVADQEDQFLSLEDIIAADDIKASIIAIEIPEWPKNGKPGIQHFRVMSAEESAEYNAENERAREEPGNQKGSMTPMVRIFTFCACNKGGDRLYTNQDIPRLMKKSLAVFARVQDTLLEMNGLTKKGQDIAKNS